jgi:ribosome-binding factor A
MIERAKQVNSLIKSELAKILLEDVDFPDGILVTLTRVETTSNLIEAKAFISVIPSEKAAVILKILSKIVYGLQKRINKRLRIRPVPKIVFVKEGLSEEAANIERLLGEIQKQDI